MKDWLEKFAMSQQKSNNMTKTASSIIVNKADLADACDGDIVSYDDAKYKVIDCNYCDDKGEGVIIEKCASLDGDPMEVAMGTAVDYQTMPDMKAQEYARKTPEIEEIDPVPAEVEKFTEDAQATEQAIAAENAIDGTTGFNHPNRILQRIVDTYKVVPAVEEPIEEDSIVDEYTDVDFEVEEEPAEQSTFDVPDTTLVAKDMRTRKVARK